MKELNRTDRLTIAAILFAVILVIGLITIKKPDIPYSLTLDETVDMVVTSKDVITQEEFNKELIKDNKYFIVDVRNPIDYQTSHIDRAKNIPIQELLEQENIENFTALAKDGLTIILFGKDQLEANGAWMILKQTGFSNVRILVGRFDHYTGMDPAVYGSDYMAGSQAEDPCCDFQEILKGLGSTAPSSATGAPEPLKIIKKEKKSGTEGGC